EQAAREPEQVRLAPALADRHRLLCERARLTVFARGEQPVDRRQQQVALLDAALLLALAMPIGQALSALQPRARLALLAPRQEPEADPERAARRRQLVPDVEARVVEPLQRLLPLGVAA